MYFTLPGLEEMPVYVGETAEKRRKIENKFREIAKRYGLSEVEFPPVMPVNLLEEKFIDQDWQVIKPGKERAEYVLTPEGTTMFAKLLEQESMPDKIFYVLKCVRENLFTQLGIEIVGDGKKNIVTTLQMAIEYLEELGIRNYIVLVNDINVLKEISDYRTLKDMDRIFGEVFKKKKKQNEAKKEFFEIYGNAAKKLLELTSESERYSELMEIINQLPENYRKKIKIEPKLARGLNYYRGNGRPGIVFEIYAPTEKGLLQICGGGVYDGFLGKLNPKLKGKEKDYGTGFAFGLERIMEVMRYER